MSTPKPFQRATIRVAIDAFAPGRPVRRFLVADETGLGKTIVARGIIEGLMERQAAAGGNPLRVFYVCNSLAIASQNRGSLLKVLPDVDMRYEAASDVDRLTLAPNRELRRELPLHLYSLTPGTSIPDRPGKHRGGSWEERALLHNLLKRRYPDLVHLPSGEEWLRGQAVTHWSSYKEQPQAQPTEALEATFFGVLREHLRLETGQQLPAAIRRMALDDPLEAIINLRVTLAKCGLKRLHPDLVILDEFQRFTDLLHREARDEDGDPRGSEIAQTMLQSGPRGPAVLLLSATPYRLFGGDVDHAFESAPHHREFYDLVEWLLGGDKAASKARAELEFDFRRYGEALRSSSPTGPAARVAKEDIEVRLRSIIARTERFGQHAGSDMTELSRVPAPLVPDDLAAFQHVVDCFRGSGQGPASRDMSSAVPYWSSVPLAMQTLGPDYAAWNDAAHLLPPSTSLALTVEQRGAFAGPAAWPHPRLRALREVCPSDGLTVPWISPSLPWWDLGGVWRSSPPQKVLLFSRFRAAPRSIAALLSYDVERHLLGTRGLDYEAITKRTVVGPSRENLAFFHTSRTLARAVDPWRLRGVDRGLLLAEVEEQLRCFLGAMGVSVVPSSGEGRTLPELIVLLELKDGAWGSSWRAWQALAEDLARTERPGAEGSLRSRVEQWNAAVVGNLSAVSPAELHLLARAALANPGVVVARALARHGVNLNTSADLLQALRVAWEGMRSYLNNSWMEAALQGGRDIRDRIWDAVVSGNLESVLDEHLWLTGTLRNLEPGELPEYLLRSLGLRTADMRLHGLGGPDFSLRAHAALAFTHEVRRCRPDRATAEAATVRTDDLRDAFNSPFWPHVLASTSVGQEGLDFHAWCATVAHWDLPGDPVDLEQREGRIDRYAGLATRRALAADIGLEPDAVAPGGSPWATLSARADDKYRDHPTGLTPWWIYSRARTRRVVFDVPLSEATAHFEYLQQLRMLYRLALGQPDQEDLVRALRGRLSPRDVAEATIDLSPRIAARSGRAADVDS